jgi:hypothetical protein
VEEKQMVRVWGVKETLVERNTEVFQAVRRPPAVPLAGEKDEASRRRGMKDRSLRGEMELSLVS